MVKQGSVYEVSKWLLLLDYAGLSVMFSVNTTESNTN